MKTTGAFVPAMIAYPLAVDRNSPPSCPAGASATKIPGRSRYGALRQRSQRPGRRHDGIRGGLFNGRKWKYGASCFGESTLLTWTGGAAARPAYAGATSAQDSPP